ncbi:serine/threonine protein kinase [Blastomyces parvus]|uniref:non-specific serine/threonine protein kinase n=1 Tax=Blastomyces parvus TaxID=2060905 RepID=A0A2B7XCJ3_9EURO|nr:serine/threonine protein kinase [Blastomyces parvus]
MAVDAEMVIGILKPVTWQAFKALELPHNKKYATEFSHSSDPKGKRRRRSIYPETPKTQLVLSFLDDSKPINPHRGFVFGSDENTCDVLLTDDPSHGVSGVHFRLSLNWHSGALLVWDESRLGTRVESKRTNSDITLEKLSHPIISGDEISAGLVIFKLVTPDRGRNQEIFNQNMRKYYDQWLKEIPSIGARSVTLHRRSTYWDPGKISTFEILGSGTSGTVHKAVDCEGKFYAVKILKSFNDPIENERAKAGFYKEAEALRELDHDHIVAVIKDMEVTGEHEAYIVMEYMPLGTLEQLGDLTPQNVVLLAYQVIDAILYIHTRGYAHRDIKPTNILVKSMEPLTFVLSDFGLVSRDPLRTFCGSDLYAAPEIYQSGPYTKRVDIWAIGIVILQYAAGLPARPTPWDHQRWFDSLAIFAPNFDPIQKTLRDFAGTILELEPDNRPSAEVCLTRIYSIMRGDVTNTLFDFRENNRRSTPAPQLLNNVTADDLRSWIHRDETKEPPRSINLTKICHGLGLPRSSMRSYLKRGGYASYVLPNTPRRRIVIGTYVSIPCAMEFVRARRPDLGWLLRELEQLDSSNATPGVPGPPRPVAPTTHSDSNSRSRPHGGSVRRSLDRSSPRASGDSVRGSLYRSSPQALGGSAQQGFIHGLSPLRDEDLTLQNLENLSSDDMEQYLNLNWDYELQQNP